MGVSGLRSQSVTSKITSVLSGFQLLDSPGQGFVGGQQPAEADKCADNHNAHLHGARPVQDGGEHGV